MEIVILLSSHSPSGIPIPSHTGVPDAPLRGGERRSGGAIRERNTWTLPMSIARDDEWQLRETPGGVRLP